MEHLITTGRFLAQALIALALPGGLVVVGIYQLIRRRRIRRGVHPEPPRPENP